MTQNKPFSSERGFTLLELIIVVAILSIIASFAFVSVDDDRDQASYEGTRDRYYTIQRALIGPTGFEEINNSPVSDGFLNDVGVMPGMLPGSRGLLDLISIPLIDNGTTSKKPAYVSWRRIGSEPKSIAAGSRNPKYAALSGLINVMHGWRGPYVGGNSGSLNLLDDLWGRTSGGNSQFVYVPPGFQRTTRPKVPKYPLVPLGTSSTTNDTARIVTVGEPQRFSADVASFDLYSRGKFGTDDEEPDPLGNNSDTFSEDYPTGATRNITVASYQNNNIEVPIEIVIRIPTASIASNEADSIYVGAVYPGIDLSEPARSSSSFHPAFNFRPDTNRPNTNLRGYTDAAVKLSDLEKRTADSVAPDPTSTGTAGKTVDFTFFKMQLAGKTDAAGNARPRELSFNKPYARRFQLVLFDLSGSPNKSLAEALRAVHPQQFLVFPKATNKANVTSGTLWDVE